MTRVPSLACTGATSIVFLVLLLNSASVSGQFCIPFIVDARFGNAASENPSVSADGRYVAFQSSANNLVPNDTNGFQDIFVHDFQTCTTERVSVDANEIPADQLSQSPSISDDGRWVAFASRATNLVSGVFLGESNIFLRDRLNGHTLLMTRGMGIVPPNGDSFDPAVDGSGTVVAYRSLASNLVPDSNKLWDVFVTDLSTHTIERVSEDSAGGEGTGGSVELLKPSISFDGRYVAFASNMNDLVPGDTNGMRDVFRKDRQTGATILVSVAMDGTPGNLDSGRPSISGDGRYVAFESTAVDLVAADTNSSSDIFVRDVVANTTTRASVVNQGGQAAGSSLRPSISGDGRYVAFESSAANLVVGDAAGFTDIFVHDRHTLITRRVSTSFDGIEGNLASTEPDIAAGGLFVTFESTASNLVASDPNGVVRDAFLVNWPYLSAPQFIDLIRNGSFAAGSNHWLTFATPDLSYIVWSVAGGVMNFYRNPPPPGTTNQAVVFQPTTAQLLPYAPIFARFDLGNTSSVRKRVSVLIHDGDFADLHVCTFWLPPNTAPQTYVMYTHTTKFWANATISFYAATAGSDGGAYQVDNVVMIYDPSGDPGRTNCLDPEAPAPIGGPPGPDLLTNGDFGAGLPPWVTFGQIVWQIASGVFEFYRPPGTPAGVVLQQSGDPMAQNQIMTAVFGLGNSSSVRKRVTVLLHDTDFSDLHACTFWLPPGAPVQTHFMRTWATEAWSNATISVYAATVGTEPSIQLDFAVLFRTPGQSIFGTDCIEPGGTPIVSGARASVGPGRSPTASGKLRAPGVRDPMVSRINAPPMRVPAASASFELWIEPHDRPVEVQVSDDGVTWRTVAIVPPAAQWTTIDLHVFAAGMHYVRLEIDRRNNTFDNR